SQIPAMITTSSIGSTLKANINATVQAQFRFDLQNTVRLTDTSKVDQISAFSSRGPTPFSSRLKPDLTAPGTTVFVAQAGSGTMGTLMSGTSEAAAHVVGEMAILKQNHATAWSVEELKALAMNHANHGLFDGPNLSGNRYDT